MSKTWSPTWPGHQVDFRNRFLDTQWWYGPTLLVPKQLGCVPEISAINMTVNGFYEIQKFKYSKIIFSRIFTLFLNMSSVWCRKWIQGDPIALKTLRIMSQALLYQKWGHFSDIIVPTGGYNKNPTSLTFTKRYGTHKWITPVTPEFDFFMQRHEIRQVSITETHNIDQKYVFKSLFSLYGAWFSPKWCKYVQGAIIWSHLMLKVIVLRSKCETTRLLMDPNDTLWLLRPQGIQNCDKPIFSLCKICL